MFGFDRGHTEQESRLLLDEIMHLVDVQSGVTFGGWTAETARLFAIDTAMTVVLRNNQVLTDADRQSLLLLLHEARRLVVGGRDRELGAVQSSLETHLPLATRTEERHLWLTAIDALVPDPFRSALISTRNALASQSNQYFADIRSRLHDRLLARLGEGSLLSEPPDPVFLTA